VAGTGNGNGPGRYCPPRHGMPFNSRAEASQCASMTWRATSARPRPYRRPCRHRQASAAAARRRVPKQAHMRAAAERGGRAAQPRTAERATQRNLGLDAGRGSRERTGQPPRRGTPRHRCCRPHSSRLARVPDRIAGSCDLDGTPGAERQRSVHSRRDYKRASTRAGFGRVRYEPLRGE
jgi:hypothetical protein